MIVVVKEFGVRVLFFLLFYSRQYINVVVVTGNWLIFTIDYYLFFIAGYCKWLIATTDSLFLFQLERMHVGLNIYSASVSFSCWRCSSASSSILSRRICVYSRNTWPHTMFNYNRSNKGSGRQNLI